MDAIVILHFRILQFHDSYISLFLISGAIFHAIRPFAFNRPFFQTWFYEIPESVTFFKPPLKCTVEIVLCFINYVTFNTCHLTHESQHKSYWENMKGQCAKVTCTGRWCNPALTTYVSSCGSLLQLSAYGAQRNLFCVESGSGCFY